jgi:hypothetical protein
MVDNNVDFLDDVVDEGDNPADAILPEESAAPAPSTVDPNVIAELEKKSKGFYDSMKDERRKRQDLQNELERIKGTVGAILEMRRQPGQGDPLTPPPKFQGIPVKETEDGDLFVPADQLQTLVSPYEAKIAALEQRLQQSNTQRNVENETERVLQSIVGEDERFGPAYQKYQAARKWVNDRVIDYQKENGMRGPMSSGQALDTVFAEESTEQEFQQRFPGLNVEDVVQAEDSKRQFKRMLTNTVKTLAPKTPPADERFRRVLNKPAGLGNTTNAKGAKLAISEKVAELSSNDIMNLSDSQVKQLERMLSDEEKNDGLTFSRW